MYMQICYSIPIAFQPKGLNTIYFFFQHQQTSSVGDPSERERAFFDAAYITYRYVYMYMQ